MEFLTASGNEKIITAIKNLNDYQILILKTNSKVEKKMIAYVGKDMKPFILNVDGRKKIVYPVRNDLKKSGNEETRKICENDIKKRNGGKISKARGMPSASINNPIVTIGFGLFSLLLP